MFEAAAALGPTRVAVLAGDAHPPIDADYPGAASTHVIHSPRFAHPVKTPMAFVTRNFRRFFTPEAAYAVDERARAELEALLPDPEQGDAVVMFRYAKTFCIGGLAADPKKRRQVFVDVDDRDDQKYLSDFRHRMGRRLADLLVAPTLVARLGRVIRRRLEAASLVWFASPEDVWRLPIPTSILPNVPFEDVDETTASASRPSESRALLYVATCGHVPNMRGIEWFLRHVWPAVRAVAPDAEIRVVGRGNWSYLRSEFGSHDGVDVVGEVGDLAPVYQAARAAICPVFEGGGSKIKVAEAAAYARPVIATTHSLRGFDAAFEKEAMIADTPKAFANACLEVLGDGPAADARGLRLRAAQGRGFSRSAVIDKIARDVDRTLAGCPG